MILILLILRTKHSHYFTEKMFLTISGVHFAPVHTIILSVKRLLSDDKSFSRNP